MSRCLAECSSVQKNQRVRRGREALVGRQQRWATQRCWGRCREKGALVVRPAGRDRSPPADSSALYHFLSALPRAHSFPQPCLRFFPLCPRSTILQPSAPSQTLTHTVTAIRLNIQPPQNLPFPALLHCMRTIPSSVVCPPFILMFKTEGQTRGPSMPLFPNYQMLLNLSGWCGHPSYLSVAA